MGRRNTDAGYGPTGHIGNNEYDRHYKWCRKYGYKPYPEFLAIVGPAKKGPSVYGPPNGTTKQKCRHRAYCRNVAGMFIEWNEYQRRIDDPSKPRNRDEDNGPTFLRPKEEIIAKILAKAAA